MIVLVMGVSGTGKSTFGRHLATTLGIGFLDADDLHPPANVRKMATGIALDDRDREPWLNALAESLLQKEADRAGLVLACSALKASYRRRLLDGLKGPRQLIWLDGPREVIAARLAARRGHFMPAALLDSQLETLEPPDPLEDAIRLDATQSLDILIAAARTRLSLVPAR